jgi:hypothetical protein
MAAASRLFRWRQQAARDGRWQVGEARLFLIGDVTVAESASS